ncbi:SGNH hydrolase-type esterase domain-containing protein [Mycena leptocephala]|nr:SGNH hydrolase-type esterase domain-containing protein [Mycena leptocephala]
MFRALVPVACVVVAALALASPTSPASPKINVAPYIRIDKTDPLIFFHGRWDTAPETWWSGSGFKLNPFFTVNATAGANIIPVPAAVARKRVGATTVVRINAEMYFSNQMNLESVDLNMGARLVPYKPSKIAFEFIGDSFSTGYTTPDGILNAWDFLIGETFKAEETWCPAGCTEDTGYYYDPVHNYTTPWNFRRDVPERTHVVVHIGANDASQNVTQDVFVDTYIDFLATIRKLYPHQPFFLFTPWGWPWSPDFPPSFYYDGAYEAVLEARQALGDHNMFLVNTTGWVTYADVYPDNLHPNVEGHIKIAGLFQAWLEDWGLHPLKEWSNP